MLWETGVACAGVVCAGIAGCSGWYAYESAKRKARHRDALREKAFGCAHEAGGADGRMASRGSPHASLLDVRAIARAVDVSRNLAHGHGRAYAPEWLARSSWIDEHAGVAGLAGKLSAEGFAQTRMELAFAGMAAGGIVGALFSSELALLLALVGLVLGWRLLPQAIKRRARERACEMECHLPEMLDVMALGMRSGLSFDRSLELYVQHFDTMLAHAFAEAQRQWIYGLATREEALRNVAATYDSAIFKRVVGSIVRSLRFGASMVEGLETASSEARTAWRTRKQEQVAKAPVKMMVPTGALILPAMLIMVLGPVFLELAGGF